MRLIEIVKRLVEFLPLLFSSTGKLLIHTFCAVMCLVAAAQGQSQNNEFKVGDSGEISVEFSKNNLSETKFISKADNAQQRKIFNRLKG